MERDYDEIVPGSGGAGLAVRLQAGKIGVSVIPAVTGRNPGGSARNRSIPEAMALPA